MRLLRAWFVGPVRDTALITLGALLVGGGVLLGLAIAPYLGVHP